MRHRRASWTVRGFSRSAFELVLRLIGLVVTGAWGAALGAWLASPSQTSLAGVVFGGVAVVFLGLLVRRLLRPGSRARLFALRLRSRRGEWEGARAPAHRPQLSSSPALGGPRFTQPSIDAHIYSAPGSPGAGPASAERPEYEWAARRPAEEPTPTPRTSDAAAGEPEQRKGEVVAEEKLGIEVEHGATLEPGPAAPFTISSPAAGQPQMVRRRRGGLIGRVGALASTALEVAPIVAPQVERLRTLGRTASAIAVSASESVRRVAADSRSDERLADLVLKKTALSPAIVTRAAKIAVAQVQRTDDAAISRRFEQLRSTAQAASATVAWVSEAIRAAVRDSGSGDSGAEHLDLEGRLAAFLSVPLRGAHPAGFEPATVHSGGHES